MNQLAVIFIAAKKKLGTGSSVISLLLLLIEIIIAPENFLSSTNFRQKKRTRLESSFSSPGAAS